MFAAPWERQLFGVTMALHERGVFAWGDFSAYLSDEIARWTASAAAGDEYVYYEHWERALSRLLDERGVIDPAAVDARAREIAALPPGHDHHDTTTTTREEPRYTCPPPPSPPRRRLLTGVGAYARGPLAIPVSTVSAWLFAMVFFVLLLYYFIGSPLAAALFGLDGGQRERPP